MNEAKKNYIKEIVEEFNAQFKSWGNSDTWTLNQFKTLESMIYEATKTNINANTLRRIFQQQTENPQTATRDALCVFLGYKSYTDFVLRQTQAKGDSLKDESESTLPESSYNSSTPDNPAPKAVMSLRKVHASHVRQTLEHLKKQNKYYVATIITLAIILSAYFVYNIELKSLYEEHLISKIKFSTSQTKGSCPLTVTFSYDVPKSIYKNVSILYEEANGDRLEKKLNNNYGNVNATYIYEGIGYAALKYKGKEIKRISIETRKIGWSVFIREERKNVFKTLPVDVALQTNGYLSLPTSQIRELNLEDANHLFVSYVYYYPNLIDGDNFELEARVRNSIKELAIPCSDVMLYLHSDTAMHGFAMNENCFAYLKFISSEQEIKGEEHNLSQFNFNPEQWHLLTIRVVDKHTTFYIDGKQIQETSYNVSVGNANEIVVRFKGCGAVDYVQLSKLNGEVCFRDDF